MQKKRDRSHDFWTCTSPHWIPESIEKVTQAIDVSLPKKHTKSETRRGERFQVERKSVGIAHLILNLRHQISSPRDVAVLDKK
jgi:hypothetical protein